MPDLDLQGGQRLLLVELGLRRSTRHMQPEDLQHVRHELPERVLLHGPGLPSGDDREVLLDVLELQPERPLFVTAAVSVWQRQLHTWNELSRLWPVPQFAEPDDVA